MPAYVIANIEITDPETYEAYQQVARPTLEEFGGRLLVAAPGERLEGAFEPKRIIVVEFPSVERAKSWWDSDSYRGPKQLRIRSTKSDIILVDGV